MIDSSDEENVHPADADPLQIDWVQVSSVLGYSHKVKCVALSSLPGCRFQNIQHHLASDLEKLEYENINDVVVLITKGEMKKYRVPNLLNKLDSKGFNVHHYPIPDGDPPSIDQMMSIIFCIKRLLDSDRRILIHCIGGLGRTCVVAACLMQHFDEEIDSEAVISLLKAVRGPRAVRTIKQYNFIHDFRELHHQWLNEDHCISR